MPTKRDTSGDGLAPALQAGSLPTDTLTTTGLAAAFTPLPRPPIPSPDAHLGTSLRIIGGIDWGYTNPTAALVFALDGDDRAWQLDEWYQRRAPLDGVVLPALAELTRRNGVSVWYCGPDEPEHIAALNMVLQAEGLACRAVAAEDAVRPGIQTVTRQLARRADGTRGLYVAPRCVHTIAEYASYQYPPQPDGPAEQERSELPLKQNDHALDATRYALCSALGAARRTRAYLDYVAAFAERRGG